MIYFVMPVGSDTRYRSKRTILDQLLVDLEEEGHFPLEQPIGPPFELEETLGEMSAAELVIGDLALERPSCYFEVGLAQGARLPVELIAPEGTPVHQVFGREDVNFYDGSEAYEDLVHRLILKRKSR